MGLAEYFNDCCDCLSRFCYACATFIYSVSLCAISCMCFGMALGFLLFIIYYVSFYPTTPSAVLEHTGMYEYVHENPELKRSVNYNYDEPDFNDQYYDDSEPGSDYLFRSKRNLTTPDPVITSTVSPTTPSSGQSSSSTSSDNVQFTASSNATSQESTTDFGGDSDQNATTKKHKSLFGHTTTTSAPEVTEYDPDFHLANIIMDSVYTYSETANIKATLGLCRQAADVQVGEYTANLFPADEANEILNCINDLLHNQTKKQLCIQLDEEMNAYLKWLILTGEPREKHKPINIGPQPDTFLFPTSECGKQPPLDQPPCLVENGFRKHLERRFDKQEFD
ncbi:hypothetical protein J6590_012397 [Homalodisca vitripennis]|nr:hypothetical protein J6590_012397 [Homalodisca vitripennis]